jgi:uncharacterized protein YdeI (YjbR/CyaY-like superfamily)
MPSRDPRIDAYIAKSGEFAQPILTHLRDVVHAACPDVEETLKWSTPSYVYGGGILCSTAAFKQHCALNFWKGALVVGVVSSEDGSAGQFGRITKISDLPSKKVLIGYVKEAMRLNDEGVTSPSPMTPKGKKPDLVVPDDLAAALAKSKTTRAAFDAFSPSQRREYVEWITEAKSDATRTKRMAQALEWIAEGKSRHWKYAR